MFSGIVSSALVKSVEKRDGDLRLTLDLGSIADEVNIGDSVSVNGVCLTAAGKNENIIEFDIMPETREKTGLAALRPLQKVNVELSIRPAERFGGHFVLGHIDGLGKIARKEKEGRYAKLWIKAPPGLTSQMVPKGAVALDGVSMTLVDVENDRFSVCVIPHTLKITTLGKKKTGDTLNIEIDMIGKYVKKYLAIRNDLKRDKKSFSFVYEV